jgi:predicted acyl esterase
MTAQGTVPGLAEVQVERDLECRMRDGTVLRADVYRPVAGGDRPVLLHRSPYDKQIAQSDQAYPHPAWYAVHGYVVVAQDVRGRWSSDGDFYPFLHEAEDGRDTIEWAARLPGCDGRVAMYGFSYAGATQLLAAAVGPIPSGIVGAITYGPRAPTACPAFAGRVRSGVGSDFRAGSMTCDGRSVATQIIPR